MGLEAATFISDLVDTNPLSTDRKKQGDDHLRLIKEVLQATFPNATKAIRFPDSVAKAANYTVLSTDQNMVITCNTAAQFTLTMPTLVGADAGWRIVVLKTSTDSNPVFIAPPSGTLNGFTKVRRSVPYIPFNVIWTGSIWVAERQNAAPIGACIDFFGTALPPGHLWPDGTTFTAADFVELNTALGGNTKPDSRGRMHAGKDDMGGSSQNRLTGITGSVDGDVLGATGGAESVTLASNQIPALTITVTDPQHSHLYDQNTATVNQGGTSNGAVPVAAGTGTTLSTRAASTGISAAYVNASQQVVPNLPPTIVCNKVLVAE